MTRHIGQFLHPHSSFLYLLCDLKVAKNTSLGPPGPSKGPESGVGCLVPWVSLLGCNRFAPLP